LIEAGEGFGWSWVNCVVDTMVSAGQYREALRVVTRWDAARLQQERRRDPAGFLLVQLNRAEALYNLGRFRCAERLLEGITADCERCGTPLVRAGLLIQKAWLSVLLGRPDVALLQVSGVDRRQLQQSYHAELFFTRAAALRELGRLDEAEQDARRAQALAQRASSKRNALFVLGAVAAAAGESRRAITLLEQGAAHFYRGQGGDGLLLLGDQYHRMGREPESVAAYRLAVARDPESRAARHAQRRLRAAGSSA
jgi:tetratricopeptide (TPR) repeat protein